MTRDALQARLREVCLETLPFPGRGLTARRHERLMEIGREDLSLARLAEAHFDALAILSEAGQEPEHGAIYGVWAAERAGEEVHLSSSEVVLTLSGRKRFCTGAGIVDRALVTVNPPDSLLIDVDLRRSGFTIDLSEWRTSAFAYTNTATVCFDALPVLRKNVIGEGGWYVHRPGFWHGAIGPASCWAGGALGLVDFARGQPRKDPHTLAHLGAMQAAAWQMQALLRIAGYEIDASPGEVEAAHERALKVRHLVERSCMEILERFGRAYGPHPLAFVPEIATRCQELTLYLRQCHAERDLDALGALLQRNLDAQRS